MTATVQLATGGYLTTTHTREAWLLDATEALAADLAAAGYTVPPVRVSVGWPKGGHGRAKAIGQCWSAMSVADGQPAIFISPELDDPVRVLDVLLHELIHAATPGCGHKGAFVKACRAMGLVAPWTATTASPDLRVRLADLARRLGTYGHARVSDAARPKQGTRMLKVECPDCGYTVRTTQKWLDVGTPTCPCGSTMEAV